MGRIMTVHSMRDAVTSVAIISVGAVRVTFVCVDVGLAFLVRSMNIAYTLESHQLVRSRDPKP